MKTLDSQLYNERIKMKKIYDFFSTPTKNKFFARMRHIIHASIHFLHYLLLGFTSNMEGIMKIKIIMSWADIGNLIRISLIYIRSSQPFLHSASELFHEIIISVVRLSSQHASLLQSLRISSFINSRRLF